MCMCVLQVGEVRGEGKEEARELLRIKRKVAERV